MATLSYGQLDKSLYLKPITPMQLINRKLQVWHYPQVPCQPFTVDVKDEHEAYKLKKVLAEQHLWLYEHAIIPDYDNCLVVMMKDKDTGDWVDYYNEHEDMEWDELVETYFATPQ